MEICLLGSLDVLDDDGNNVQLAGPRLRALLTVLALHCGEVVSDDALIDAVWGDEPPARSANALQRQISTLRTALGTSDLIERRGSGYVLTLDPSAVDVLSFDALAERGFEAVRREDVAQGRVLLENALRLWRGEPLADVAYAEFAQPEIARLNEARAVVLEARIDADLALGRDAELIAELEQLVLQYPLRERMRAQLMLALARAGRPAEALRAYQTARQVLGEELGLEPSAELRALETAIVREEVALARSPTANALSRPRTNARTPLTRTVGRAAEIDSLFQRLTDHRLVTLVGPGGVGKSRLALEVAHRWLDARDCEVWIVELADVERDDDVVPAILRALALPQAGSRSDDGRRLFEYLCKHAALLVLDNCEHLIATVARVTQDLLESCANLRICATSREGLAVPSEVLIPVPPLSLDDAVALFDERARAADASFDGTTASSAREAVAEICARIDGLPLAIELAAARLRAMSIAELVAGLDDRFRFLNRGARTALPRQQTLRAVVDWSYDLLFDDERLVFERLSVFRGNCSLAAARVVCADDDISPADVAELVARLVDKSLVLAERDEDDGYTRCRMLQTLVDYGRDRLEESGDAARVYRAHIDYYRDFASRSLVVLQGVKQRGWLRAVNANLPNLRAALDASVDQGDAETAQRIAGCLGWYWWFTGRAVEGAQWLALAQSCPGAVEELTDARVMAWSAFTGAPGFVGWSDAGGASLQHRHGAGGRLTFAELDDLCRRAIAVYERHPQASEELAGVELALSVAYSTVGDFARAHELVANAEDLLADARGGTSERHGVHTFATARRSFLADDYATAEEDFRSSAASLRAQEVDVYESFALRYYARLALLNGDIPSAIDALDRAVHVAEAVGLTGFANMLLGDLAQAFAASGDFERARAMLTTLLAAAREVGFLPGASEALTALALVEWRAGADTSAAEFAREGADAAARIGHREAVVYCNAVVGLVADAADRSQEGLDWLGRALAGARDVASAPRAIAFILDGYAAIAARQDTVKAARLLGAAESFRRAPGRAAGAAFATTALSTEESLARLSEKLRADVAAAAAFDAGAADPGSVVTAILADSAATPDR